MTCAKKIVRCVIITKDGETFYGENSCNKPQVECPRTEGEGYDKCKDICMQEDHAEIRALREARFIDISGSTAIITGIDHLCKPCARALSDKGVAEIILRK